MKTYAPIALFVYNRLPHVKQVIQAIKKNPLSRKSTIYIFSDFSDVKAEKEKIDKIRKFLKKIDGFKKKIIVERKTNLGTSKNIVSGLNHIFEKYNKCIIIEDDILISKNFLTQMNYFLQKFKNIKNIASIEGYMYPINFDKSKPEYFLIKGSGCWGWATWKKSWKHYERSAKKLVKKFEKNKILIHEFDFYSSYPFFKMLKKQLKANNSWAIKWAASNFLKGRYTIYFKNSLVKNIGLDGTGVNCKVNYELNQKKFTSKNVYVNKKQLIQENFSVKKDIAKYLKSSFGLNKKLFYAFKQFLS